MLATILAAIAGYSALIGADEHGCNLKGHQAVGSRVLMGANGAAAFEPIKDEFANHLK
jgi:hypothetical protein